MGKPLPINLTPRKPSDPAAADAFVNGQTSTLPSAQTASNPNVKTSRHPETDQGTRPDVQHSSREDARTLGGPEAQTSSGTSPAKPKADERQKKTLSLRSAVCRRLEITAAERRQEQSEIVEEALALWFDRYGQTSSHKDG